MVADYTFFAEGSKRFRAALRGELGPIPVYAQMHEYAAARSGIAAIDFYRQAERMVPALLEAQAAAGLDVASLTYDIYNIEAEALGQAILYTEAGLPDVDRSLPLILSPADLERIHTPNFEQDGRFAKVIEMMRCFEAMTGVSPALGFCAPFSLAANLCGVEKLLMDIYETPEYVQTLFDLLTEKVLAPWIFYQRSCLPLATSVTGADAMASMPIINLSILRDWVTPWIERLRLICGTQVSVANWVGESHLKQPSQMLDLKLKVGPGSLLGQDPDVEVLGPRFYKEYAEQHNVPLILGIGAAFLAKAQPGEVTERVERYIQEGRPKTGFALYLCNIGPTTPPENVTAAVQAAHSFA
jgi:uroporphyrinogen-III decarboxylase